MRGETAMCTGQATGSHSNGAPWPAEDNTEEKDPVWWEAPGRSTPLVLNPTEDHRGTYMVRDGEKTIESLRPWRAERQVAIPTEPTEVER